VHHLPLRQAHRADLVVVRLAASSFAPWRSWRDHIVLRRCYGLCHAKGAKSQRGIGSQLSESSGMYLVWICPRKFSPGP
jgi:hypothetical protein